MRVINSLSTYLKFSEVFTDELVGVTDARPPVDSEEFEKTFLSSVPEDKRESAKQAVLAAVQMGDLISLKDHRDWEEKKCDAGWRHAITARHLFRVACRHPFNEYLPRVIAWYDVLRKEEIGGRLTGCPFVGNGSLLDIAGRLAEANRSYDLVLRMLEHFRVNDEPHRVEERFCDTLAVLQQDLRVATIER